MSVDHDCSPEIAALIGTSAALAISDIPWNGPVSALKVGLVDGKLVFNPTAEQRKTSDLDVTVVSTGKKVVMAAAETAGSVIAVVNKADLPQRLDLSAVAARFSDTVCVCARTGEGLDGLEHLVAARYPEGETPTGEILTAERQQEAAQRARDAIRRAGAALSGGLTPDAVLTDVEEALSALGELTGKTAKEEIVSRIFSRFCVGK